MKPKNLIKLFLLCLIIVTASCKKESNPEAMDSYLKFKLDGNWVTYEAIGELGPDLLNDELTDFGISARTKDNVTIINITIQIEGSDFKTGSYATNDPRLNTDFSYLYFPDNNLSAVRNYELGYTYDREPSRYVINVTSITPTQLKGTFTGNYLVDETYLDDPDGGVRNITEGEFQVRRIR